jgi:SSS family solute:Na+ symporter
MVNTAEIITVGIYLLAMIVIGIIASRKIRTSEDYIVAGRSLGFWMFTLLMIGTVCSGMSLLGVSGLGFATGMPSMWEPLFVPLSIAFCIIVFGVKLRHVAKKKGYLTVQDYFAHRFESPRALRSLSAMAGIIVSLIYLSGQYTAISIVLVWLFGIPPWTALVIAALIVTLYTVIGGLYAVAWTTFVQTSVLIIGVLVMAPLVILSAGGITHINDVLAGIDPNLVMPWFPATGYAPYAFLTPQYVVSFGIMLMIGLACAPHVINNVLTVKEERYFRWVPLIAFAAYALIMVLIKYAGFAGKVLVSEGAMTLPAVKNAQDFVFVYGVEHATGSLLLYGIFAVIVLAAVMSTTDRLMLTIGSMFGWDIYRNVLKPDADDKSVLRISQITTILAGILTVFLAIRPPDYLAFLIWLGIGIMLATFAVPLLAGMYWRRATREGALAAMACGLGSAVIIGGLSFFKIMKYPIHFSFYALIISAIAMILVSLATKPTDTKILDETLTGWYIQPR